IIQELFDRLDVPAAQGIHSFNRWNIDETGVPKGKGSNGRVLGSAALRITISRKLAWITGMNVAD
ncbi:hypothetical protein LZ32DRAFT_546394, partial [Colletotrichum eremochloae]